MLLLLKLIVKRANVKTMKCWLLFIFSCISFIHFAQAQNVADSVSMAEQDSLSMVITSMPVDSTLYVEEENTLPPVDTTTIPLPPKRNFQPQVFIDYGKLLTTAIGLENKLEGGVSMLFFDKFEAVAEFGRATLKPEHAYVNGNYKSSGEYLRLGGGLMSDINAKSSIGLGVRYGLSRYSDSGVIDIRSSSGLQDDYQLSFNRPRNKNEFTARWWSLVLTTESRIVFNKSRPEAKVNYLVRLGMFFRMRFLVTYDNDPFPVEVYSIPGYGNAVNKQQAALNFYIKFTP